MSGKAIIAKQPFLRGFTGSLLSFRTFSCLLAGLALCWLPFAQAQQFTVQDAKTTLVDSVYRLDADLVYEFSPTIFDAMENGVVMTLVLDIEVFRPRRYFWDDVIAELEQRYEVQYFAISDQYILRNLNSGTQFIFPSLASAIDSMSRIRNLPIIDAALLAEGEHYMVRVRSRLDFGSLPVPLQLRAYVSRDWWLGSGWYSWDL